VCLIIFKLQRVLHILHVVHFFLFQFYINFFLCTFSFLCPKVFLNVLKLRMFFVLPKFYFNSKTQIFYYMMSILDINIERVKSVGNYKILFFNLQFVKTPFDFVCC